jgi:hypothetical protein
MKKIFFILLTTIMFGSCMTNYPTTTFYVKNTSDNTQNFKASIMKYSSMGPYEMTLPFAVPAQDSVVARKVEFRQDAIPTAWFTEFIIFPSDSVAFNDPKNPENWVKSTDEKGKTVYTFTMTK